MEIRQLEYFVASVEEKSFYKASEKLYVSQPAISKAIAKLESDLDEVLFLRTSKGLQLTARGEKIYHYAKNILQQIDIMKTDESTNKNHLRISSYPSLLISNIITDFYNDCESSLEIDYREGSVQDIIDNVNTGISEIGIVYVSPNQQDTLIHILSHNNLEFVPIKENELCIYVGKQHEKYTIDETISIDEMANCQYIRGLRDYFSVEHHFDYVNLNEINTSKFQDVVVTNSDHLVSIMLEKTNLCYLGIDTKRQTIQSKATIDTENKKVMLGYIKNKLSQLEEKTASFLENLSQSI
ncbi:MAG: LysR family transcriptional regulator [Bacillota bacterium]